jgi:hypothetical protein
MDEKRRAKRLKEEIEITITVVSGGGNSPKEKVLYNYSKDISESGARIMANILLPVDTLLKVDFKLKHLQQTITALGKVKWIKILFNDESYEAGVEFVNTPGEAIHKIADYISWKQKSKGLKVVDAETGRPIEGAVLLAEWTEVKELPGHCYSDNCKIMEAITDREGNAAIEELIHPLSGITVFAPRITVYKKGYVAWNSEYIFPGRKKRTDFKWGNNYIFKLEKFKPGYSYDNHISFIQEAHNFGLSSGKKQLIKKAYEWEEHKALEERSQVKKN